MAKAVNNTVLHGVGGKPGGIVVRQMLDRIFRRISKPDSGSHKSSQLDPPVIRRVEQSDERILVHAIDHVIVTNVRLTLLDAVGEVLEIGEAIRKEGDCWEYISRRPGKILIVEACDLAGHVTRLLL